MKELSENEIRIIGDATSSSPSGLPHWRWVAVVCAVVLLCVALWWCGRSQGAQETEDVYFDKTTVVESNEQSARPASHSTDTLVGITLCDTVVNDIPIAIYCPHNLRMALRVGKLPDTASDSVLMALQAADLRADNMQIVSAFVLHGELLSRGTAKLGFCAIIDGKVTLGVDEATPYFERAIAEGGDFFRQYPLVADGKLVENRIKNKAIRRALVMLDGQVVVVATRSRESLHDFSQALVDIGATTAINLVGSRMTTGWINLGDSIVAPDTDALNDGKLWPDNVNYIVWTK